MSYRKATVADIDKNITQFFTDEQGTRPATKQPTKDNIANYYVLSTLGDEYDTSKSNSTKGGSRHRARRRPSRKYKKSAKRVFRKKSRSTRRR